MSMKLQQIVRAAAAAIALFSIPAWAGVAEADAAYGRGDYATALAEFRAAADQGLALAQYKLGRMYDQGQGVPQDYQQAAQWYRKAADQGFALAQNNLGWMYDNGQGVPQDYQQAGLWYRKAADQGLADAQNNLGTHYEWGFGTPQSRIVAYALYNLSATNDPSNTNNATKNRERVLEEMTPKEIQAAQDLTRALIKPGNFGTALDSATRRLQK